MNIYIKMEILERELEGRLLLALIAAERGHDVLLGDFRALLSHRFWLVPGLFHDKSVTPSLSKRRLMHDLRGSGFVFTSQDEEHGLSEDTYDAFARRRFSNETVGLADAILTWGPHDTEALLRHFPDQGDRFLATGSPRVDVWRRDLASLQDPRPGLAGAPRTTGHPAGLDPDRPYVLFSTSAHPFQHNPFWVMMRDARPSQFPGPDDEREWVHYEKLSVAYSYVSGLVRAIRSASRRLPDLQFVVRPHPTALVQAWHDVLGPVGDNVHVIKDGGSGRWIEHAVAMVHNGSTTGIEAAARGVPTISFQPNGERRDMFANRFGRVATDGDELTELLTDAVVPGGRAAWWAGHDPQPLLEQRFAALDGPLAADRIVDRWEELARPGLEARNRPRAARALATTHRRIGSARTALRERHDDTLEALDVSGKFPPVSASRLRTLVDAYRTATGRFADVMATRIGPDLVHITRQGG